MNPMNHTELACFSDGFRYASDGRNQPPAYARARDGVASKEREAVYFWDGYDEARYHTDRANRVDESSCQGADYYA